MVENLTAELTLTQPGEIERHLQIFGRPADAARYGPQARAIVTRALADLTATMD